MRHEIEIFFELSGTGSEVRNSARPSLTVSTIQAKRRCGGANVRGVHRALNAILGDADKKVSLRDGGRVPADGDIRIADTERR